MRIVEIEAKINGAHGNQMIDGANPNTFPVPVGWAILPESVVCENFPFGEITLDGSNPPVVTSWTPGEIPEPDPVPEPEPAPTLEERVGSLEQSKANQADVDELNEALNMILTGATR